MNALAPAIGRDGFALLPAAWSGEACAAAIHGLNQAAERGGEGVLRTPRGVYGMRQVEQLWPGLVPALRASDLATALRSLLGDDALLVRAILFDKPPEQGWGVDWHRDQSIAVRSHEGAPPGYDRPTVKHGVPHLDAPAVLLEQMLIARLHLDATDLTNGALQVLPGSHIGPALADDEIARRQAHTVLAAVGDALLMRPRLYHASRPPAARIERHRRVLHLECAPAGALPPPLAWACCIPLAD